MDVSAFNVLCDPEFLRGYTLFIVQVAIASIIGGGLGAAVGALIYRNDWLTEPVKRFFRLGMWMPFFILWGLMYWGDRMVWNVNIDSRPILALVVAASPPTVLASCYYYLCLSGIAELDKGLSRIQLVRAIVFQALPICLLLQISSAFVRPWPWAWFASWPYYPAVASAFGVLLGLTVLLINAVSFSTFERTALVRGRIIALEISGARGSFGGMISIIGICLVLWVIFERSLKEMFLFSSPTEVLRAEYQLFVTGIQGMQVAAFNGQTEWRDVGISLLEILAGIGLAGGVGFAVSKALEKAPLVPKTISFHLLSLSYITPIALWQAWFPWLGVGIWHKIVLIACLTFFPVVQTFWIFRETPVLFRTTIAIDEALPLAFVGMILGELWASTAGIGFFILMSRATSSFAESTAMSLFGFALLVVISFALRCAIGASLLRGKYQLT